MNLPKIGQGTTFGGKKYYDNKKLKLYILEHGLYHGINLVDTGEYYEGGQAEELVAEFIKGKRSQVIISDKFKASNNSYQNVIKSCESSLKKLQTNYIDIYSIQWWNPEVPVFETLSALLQLKSQGKICEIGICNFTFSEIKFVANQFYSLQTEFNLQNRLILKDVLLYCKSQDKAILGYNIFNQGFLKPPSYLHDIATKYSKTPYQIILAWALSKGLTMLTNTMNPVHLKENIEAIELKLKKEDLDLIDSQYNAPIEIPIDKISVEQQHIDESVKVYTSLIEVINNANNISPNPFILADEIKQNGLLKPIEVKQSKNGYQLSHGSARFWAWQIAFKDKPILAFVT